MAQLEAQQRALNQVRMRWESARRIQPGEITFWNGASRDAYEIGVGMAFIASRAIDDALAAARVHTRTALESVRSR